MSPCDHTGVTACDHSDDRLGTAQWTLVAIPVVVLHCGACNRVRVSIKVGAVWHRGVWQIPESVEQLIYNRCFDRRTRGPDTGRED